MKKAITIRWIAVFFTAIFINAYEVVAQIKIVGDDYSTELTGSNSYYDCDVDFEKYFPSVSPIERFSRMFPYLGEEDNRIVNLTNDTVYICENHKLCGEIANSSFAIINNEVKDLICSKGTITIPSGYYVITGYVFCQDNSDSLRASVGLDCKSYYFGNSVHREQTSIHHLKEQILIEGAGFTSWDLDKYKKYIILRTLDNTATYYLLSDPGSVWREKLSDCLLLRYYNEIKAFVGKTVVLKTRNNSWIMETIKNSVITDGISGNVVKLEDEKYEVIDVVLKDCGVFIILKGEVTGTISFKTNYIYYAYSTDHVLEAEGCVSFEDANYVEDFDNTTDVPLINIKYEYRHNALIVEEESWKTLEQRAKKTKEQQEKDWELQQQRKQQEKAKNDAAFKQQMIAKHGSQFGELVANKQVAIGMTKDMCRDAWGGPINTYKTTTRLTTEEVWCYNYKTRIYFVNDKVVRIEN